MINNSVAFGIHNNIGPCIPETLTRGYRNMTIYIIFYVKLDTALTRKARLVADICLRCAKIHCFNFTPVI